MGCNASTARAGVIEEDKVKAGERTEQTAQSTAVTEAKQEETSGTFYTTWCKTRNEADDAETKKKQPRHSKTMLISIWNSSVKRTTARRMMLKRYTSNAIDAALHVLMVHRRLKRSLHWQRQSQHSDKVRRTCWMNCPKKRQRAPKITLIDHHRKLLKITLMDHHGKLLKPRW